MKGLSTHTIKSVSLGTAITYTTLEEFLNNIAAKTGAAKTLCVWVFKCADEIITAINNYSDKHSKIITSENKEKEYNELFELFKTLLRVYLKNETRRKYKSDDDDKTTTKTIPSKLLNLLQSSGGGKKRKLKKKTKKELKMFAYLSNIQSYH